MRLLTTGMVPHALQYPWVVFYAVAESLVGGGGVVGRLNDFFIATWCDRFCLARYTFTEWSLVSIQSGSLW